MGWFRRPRPEERAGGGEAQYDDALLKDQGAVKGQHEDPVRRLQGGPGCNFMQIDEVRYAEDLWVRLGLQDVLYDPKTKLLYTPNTNKLSRMEPQALKGAEGGETE